MSEGKILRIKQGYNPNSSSIGSIIFSMSAAVLPAVAVFGAVAAMLSTAVLERAAKRGGHGATSKRPPAAGGGDVP